MGKKRTRDRQANMWVATADLPTSAGHPFYARLNRVLDDAGVDPFVEAQCAQFYADGIGRPSLAPGRYFRLLLLGYFEGLDSERAIAWRATDSLSIRAFLDFALKVIRWFVRHPRYHLHFTPTSASWLNQIERFFSTLTTQRIRRGTFENVRALELAIEQYLAHYNEHCKPFVWTATADAILEKVTRFCERTSETGH